MKIIKQIEVPTGHILVIETDHGKLELVSLGDYGKDHNLKADFLGLERKIDHVEHTKLLPLTEKWVITVSSQYGCSSGCMFCDVPKVGNGINCSLNDLQQQLIAGLSVHPEITYTKRLNVHIARMGETTWNPNVLDFAKWMKEHIDPEYKVHPVVSTMMPNKNEWLKTFIHNWMRIKNRLYHGNAGLQLSINSTDEKARNHMFSMNCLPLHKIAKIMDGVVPIGRKITLNFAIADYEIDGEILTRYFNPEHFLCKLTPMHKTDAAIKNGLETKGDYTTYYPYKDIESNLKKHGYDVIVFIASKEEDEGMITCGNAVLSGKTPSCGKILFPAEY